jgi:hypothetical protein
MKYTIRTLEFLGCIISGFTILFKKKKDKPMTINDFMKKYNIDFSRFDYVDFIPEILIAGFQEFYESCMDEIDWTQTDEWIEIKTRIDKIKNNISKYNVMKNEFEKTINLNDYDYKRYKKIKNKICKDIIDIRDYLWY